VLALGDNVHVVVREIDDRGKVSLDLADGVELEVREGATKSRSNGGSRGGDRGGDRGGRDRSDGGRSRSRDKGGRDRDRGRERDKAPAAKEGRTVVSFEDEFESGL